MIRKEFLIKTDGKKENTIIEFNNIKQEHIEQILIDITGDTVSCQVLTKLPGIQREWTILDFTGEVKNEQREKKVIPNKEIKTVGIELSADNGVNTKDEITNRKPKQSELGLD